MARPPRPVCPNETCPNHTDPPADFYRKNGWFKRKHDSRKVPRYQCRDCGRSFCSTQTQVNVHQHRPDLNRKIFGLAVSGATMRRIAALTGCDKGTVQAKIEHLARQARAAHKAFLLKLPAEGGTGFVMMDGLETYIHARYKRVSVPIVVRVKTGQVLAFGVARIPSTMKLGGAGTDGVADGGSNWQTNDRPKVVPTVLATVRPVLKRESRIATDGDSNYPKWIAAQRRAYEATPVLGVANNPLTHLATNCLRRWLDVQVPCYESRLSKVHLEAHMSSFGASSLPRKM